MVVQPERGVPEDAPSLDQMADDIGAPIMTLLHRGHVPGRSGEIMLVPRPHRFIVGEWDLTRLGTNDPDLYTSHPNPWNYLTRVPIILYGPRWIARGREVPTEVDIADVAPTYAKLLGMRGLRFDGEPLSDALLDADRERPRAIFTVVIDGGGWNALQEHPQSHPTIDWLRRHGTTYVNATIGSTPSITGALHANFGTGLYPIHHRIPGNQLRDEGGDPTVDAWLQSADPRYLEAPTVSELWDERNNNEPVVGTVSYEGWHLGMIGHGAQRRGADPDVAVLWRTDENTWESNEDYYILPSYLMPPDIGRLESYERALDGNDGIKDGTWFGHTLEEIQDPKVRPGTSAFARFTGDAVMKVLRNEEVGQDRMTDLFWVEMKQPDFGGHIWNVMGPEQGDTLLEVDRQLARYKAWLDEEVGRNDYILVVSADHGQEPNPDAVGGWRINSYELERDIEARFGAPVVQKVTPVEIFMDVPAMEDEGISLTDIARFLGSYTLGENIPDGRPGATRVPQGRRPERLFAGAFPTGYLSSLDGEAIAAFADSVYPEGDLTVEAAP